MAYKMPREFYIPKGSRKVAHKHSDAVAYVGTNGKGKPYAAVFYGAQAKPVSHVWYRSEERREQHVTELFASRQATLVRKAAFRQERKSFTHSVQVGDIFHTSWGYDQTNVEFFEVTKLIGEKMCEIREIASAVGHRGQGCDSVVAQSGAYLTPRYEGDDRGLPMRKRIQGGGELRTHITIDDVRTAWPWGERIAGVVVGRPLHETALGWGH